MDDKKFHSLLGRALTDSGFRDRLMNPEDQVEALAEVGITANDEILSELNNSVDALTRLSRTFGGPVAAA